MHVLALDALVADTLRMRDDAAAAHEQSVDDLLAVVTFGLRNFSTASRRDGLTVGS